VPTVKDSALLVPLGLVIVTLCTPAGAPERIVKVVYALPLVSTVSGLNVIPGPASIVIPSIKFFPFMVTKTDVPQLPAVVLKLVRVGAGGAVTTKGKALLVPPKEVSVTL